MITLKNIIDIEEKLLLLKTKNKFDISFNDFLKLEDYINLIGNITNKYFYLTSEFYNEKLKNSNFDNSTKKNELTKYNNMLLNSEIDINIEEILTFIEDNK